MLHPPRVTTPAWRAATAARRAARAPAIRHIALAGTVLLPTILLVAPSPARAQSACSLTNRTSWCAHQDSSGVSGGAEDGDRFAAALAFGDFNGDGFDDLAVGVPGENNGAGVVHVFYSNGNRLDLAGQQLFGQDDVACCDGDGENGDEFGFALASGDFDGDGFDDLAVGSPGEDLPEDSPVDCSFFECEDAGLVHVISGSAAGLQPVTTGTFFSAAGLEPGAASKDDARLGSALATGDLSHFEDGYDDLAVGGPRVDADPVQDGVLYTVFGHPDGLDALDDGREQGAFPPCDSDGDQFASALAVMKHSSGAAEVAVGLPACSVSGAAGGAAYLYDSAAEIAAGPVLVQSDYASASNGNGDRFGAAVAAGDFDGNGLPDLAVGAPNKNHGAGNPDDSGRVYVAYSFGDGPQPSFGPDIIGEDEWAGDTPGAGELFGSALAAGDVDGDGFDDLLAGAPGEGSADVGRVYLKRGSSGSGLTTAGNALFTQTFLGGVNGDDDHLGNVLALGDVDGDGVLEIALGVPDKDVGSAGEAGMVYVTRAFNPFLFANGFESGTTAAWGGSTP
jgi:hypothetical protein